MEEKLKTLKELTAEIMDIYNAAQLLEWDQQVNMPPGGAEQRGNQMATLQRLVHTKTISPEYSKLIEDLVANADQLDSDSDDARLIAACKRFYDQRAKVPPEFTAEYYKTIS